MNDTDTLDTQHRQAATKLTSGEDESVKATIIVEDANDEQGFHAGRLAGIDDKCPERSH